jgi:predicted nuclease of restriction endonuclease-like RecB superfamily
VLHYLTERDYPWLRALIDEYERGVGSKRSAVLARLREPLTSPAPKFKQRLAAEVLGSLSEGRVRAPVPPRDARWELFRAAAATTAPRNCLVERVASELGTDSESLDRALFADLRSECNLAPLPSTVAPASLAVEANMRLVNGWLLRARSIRISAWGQTRALVRQARLHGLICNIERAPIPQSRAPSGPAGFDAVAESPLEGVQLEVSGPLSLFRHTLVYGRALCALLPRALWCSQFELTALCEDGPGNAPMTLVVRSGDPLRPGRELKPFDSKLEQRFARDFRKAAPDWDVVREPRPLESSGTLIFPDFELVHRRDRSRRFLLEIIGFWTPRYLQDKLAKLRQAQLDNVILCIDEARACSDAELPSSAWLVRYKRRIDPLAVLNLVNGPQAK